MFSAEPDNPLIAVAACFAALPDAAASAGERVLLQITPAQDFGPNDGRAMDVPRWRMDEQIAQQVVAAFDATQPLVIDYEHQTLHKEANGQPAPAAGWIHGLRWLPGRGLFAEAQLTQRARDLIAAGEYRYFSPVFEYARAGTPRAGQVLRIRMGALTNNPAISGMQALHLAAAASARWAGPAPDHRNLLEDTHMTLLQKLLAALGLPDDTAEEAALSACAARRAQADAALAALDLPADARADAVSAACAAARASAAPDPARYVPVEVVQQMQAGMAALSARMQAREVDELIAPALADGRLLPAQQAWARELGQKDLAALSAYLKTAQPIAALSGTQTQGRAPAQAPAHGLSADELAVAAACGLTPEAFAAGKAG